MSEATLRAELKAVLTALPGLGVVHDYGRWVVDPAGFLALFKDAATGRIFGWEITRPGFRVEWANEHQARVVHTFAVNGYLGLQDAAATEKLFDAALGVVTAALVWSQLPSADGKPRVRPAGTVDTRMFGAVLCHHAEVKLEVAEVLERAEAQGLDDFLKFYADWNLAGDPDHVDATDHVTLPAAEE